MLLGLRTVIFQVDDVAAARDWYAELLGFGPYFDEPFYVGFDVGGFELGLHPTEDRQPGVGGDCAYWGVPDIDEAMGRLAALGATIRSPPQDVGGGIRLAEAVDPFGNLLGVIFNPHFDAASPNTASPPSSE